MLVCVWLTVTVRGMGSSELNVIATLGGTNTITFSNQQQRSASSEDGSLVVVFSLPLHQAQLLRNAHQSEFVFSLDLPNDLVR